MAILPYLGAAVSVVLGIFGTFWPHSAAALVGIRLDPAATHSISEVRATYGGLFLGVGLFCLISGSPGAFLALGCGALGTALVRIGSILFDHAASGKNWVAAAFEFGLAALLIIPVQM